MRGLYIHIPFCKTRCHYCNFVSIADSNPEFRQRFFKALSHEADEAREKYGELVFDTVYWGGGTPSFLNITEMTKLMEMIKGRFKIKEGAEITCEWNPGDGDGGKLKAFRMFGVNRISLGVQSFQDSLLERLGRRHSAEDVLKTLEKIRGAGIRNISFDLMLRIPGQTLSDFQASLKRCIELAASQVSLYDLEVHGNTVFGNFQKANKLELPSEEEHAAMYQSAIDMLTRAGYEHYEISNFAKPSMASQHNLIYWHNQEYLGLGPGAFSYLNGVRYQFAPDFVRYLEKCEAGDRKNDTEDRLSEEEKETETFVMGLRLREGAALEAFSRIRERLAGRLQPILNEGLIERSGKNIRLTDRGKFLSEEVFGFLLQTSIPGQACL